jgi:dUTP pyrophosphatase
METCNCDCIKNSAPVLKVKKNYEDAILPTKAYPTDSGFDVYIHSFKKLVLKDETIISIIEDDNIKIMPMERVLIDTGISATVEPGYEIQVRPKSGLAIKNGLTVLNTPGTVDESFRDSIGVIVINLSNCSQILKKGMKIAQIVPMPVLLCEMVIVENLNETERGNNGYGSTGV